MPMPATSLARRPGFDAIHDIADQQLARQVAQAAGSFEHGLLGRAPTSVTVVAAGGWMVVNVHEVFSAFERRLARDEAGRARVRHFHRRLFDATADALREHVRVSTGVTLRGGLAHVDTATGSVLKTFTTNPAVELFLLGQGLPALGVPVNDHLHSTAASGSGAARH